MPKKDGPLLHQAAAVLGFLKKNDFAKAAKKLEEKLIKDYGHIPKDLDGEWNWVEYETESSEEESSSSEEDDESFAGNEVDEQLSNSPPPPRSLRRAVSLDESSTLLNATQSRSPKKEIARSRSISFSDDVETITITPRKGRKNDALYWSKMDLQRMKMESQMEKMNELITATGATMGLNLSSHL